MKRRTILTAGSLAVATGAGTFGWNTFANRQLSAGWAGWAGWKDPWWAGPVHMILPSATHDRLRLKVIFSHPMGDAPQLKIGHTSVPGVFTDSDQSHVIFDSLAHGLLKAGTEYELRIMDANGVGLTDSWPLRTFPAPDQSTTSVRLLAFTCMGGADVLRDIRDDSPLFVHSTARSHLLRRALAFNPDAVVAIGDHVYWDLRSRTSALMGRSPLAQQQVGLLDRDQTLLGGTNEARLKKLAESQIPAVYGNLLRSTPAYFVQDDHDYFENDYASESLKTFPVDRFMREAAAATQRLYYPEFLDAPEVPGFLKSERVGRHFGRMRFGNLLEVAFADCRRFLSLGPNGRFLPEAAESWLLNRQHKSDAAQVLNVPSAPMQWTVGKWAEWYPDTSSLDRPGQLTVKTAKPYWSAGWKAQHDRWLSAIAERRRGLPMVLSGDIHATALGQITEVADRSLGSRTVVTVLAGTPGAAGIGWPSSGGRGQRAETSRTLGGENFYEPVEENGFSLIDVSRDAVTVSQFRWLPEMGAAAIDRLTPFNEHTFQCAT